MLWLALLVESGIVRPPRMAALHKEADELLRICVTAI